MDGLMKRPRDRDLNKKYIAPEHFVGSITISDLEFAYPSEHKIPVLHRLSLKIEPKDKIALLGKVGSGKSTLLRLAAGLYLPAGGRISIDDIDMRQLDPAELRSQIGYVGQDPQLFMGSLRENLVLSDGWLSDAAIIDVLKKLDFYNVVATHPRGLDMPLTESGGGLSGGQRQLITVARMILRNPKFVFMDEPTSHMDQNTEAIVIRVLQDWIKDRTVMLATHRPQLLQWVNKIAIVEKGQIILEGPRDEILQKISKSNATSQVSP
jgi:ATP-binding cassette subfamily C protein LapB